MYMIIAINVIAFLSVLIAVRGKTWKSANSGLKKVTPTGWITAVLGAVATALAILKGFHEAAESEYQLGEARARIQTMNSSVLESERRIRDLQAVIIKLRTPVDVLLVSADSLYWNGKFTEALDEYNSLLAIDPRSSDAWIGKAFCYMSQHYGRRISVGPTSSVEEFWGEKRIDSEALNKAYDAAMKALEVSATDLARLKANVIIGLSLLSMGEIGSHGGPGGRHGFPNARGRPAHFFIDALRIAEKENFSGSGSPIVQHNTKLFYTGFARVGLSTIAMIGNNDWELGKYIEEFNLSRLVNKKN